MIVHKVWFTPLGPSTCMGVPVLLVYVCMYAYCVYMYPAYYTLSSLVPQLVEVAGCDMWVMEQIDSPSSDPPQTGHPRHKVHAQQYPISSLERSAVSPQKYGMLLLSWCV